MSWVASRRAGRHLGVLDANDANDYQCDRRMTFVASPRIYAVSGAYTPDTVRIYAPDAAFTHMCLYAVVGAFTRVGAYTHPRVRRIRTPGCGVYAPQGAAYGVLYIRPASAAGTTV